ncbi:iron-containing redox enzyme family protein [Burkholderia gladioli]|uniref:iron-containing redox enzyme family protein n=1 Tax=Burkholderia gladioli TaxID=28095 RepID=UPI001FC86CBF|nr:iron-containing redox enzyme family protein [Burkholderia gladioli]
MMPLSIQAGRDDLSGSSFPFFHERSVLAMPLSGAIAFLTSVPSLDDRIPPRSHFPAKLVRGVDDTVRRARRDEQALTELHRSLFALYELHVADPVLAQADNQFSPFLTALRRRLESRWLDEELRQVKVRPVGDAPGLIAAIRQAVSSHAASRHPLFDWLAHTASLSQIQGFFRSDAPLNIRFFDLIVMAMIGSMPEVRTELASNFWDEAGRGHSEQSHVHLFRQVLEQTGVGQVSDDFASHMTWQGLRGYNLFMLCALNRRHYFKLLGIMAATELLDPPQYRKLLVGCRRLGWTEATTAYYDEHVSVDEVHGEGWLQRVILPLTERTPAAIQDVMTGCMLRLSSCNDYYDDLYRRLKASTGRSWGDQDEANDENGYRTTGRKRNAEAIAKAGAHP